MDNFFEILIYLFIIFSIFSPLFKKKEQKPPPPRQNETEDNYITPSPVTMEKDKEEYDILNEIENLFKTDASRTPEIKEKMTAIEQKEGKKQTPIEKISERKKPDFYKPIPEPQPVYSEHRYTDWSKKVEIDDEVARKAAVFAQLLEKKKNISGDENIRRIRSKLKNPEAIKDFIIFAEIIGKPKAHRR